MRVVGTSVQSALRAKRLQQQRCIGCGVASQLDKKHCEICRKKMRALLDKRRLERGEDGKCLFCDNKRAITTHHGHVSLSARCREHLEQMRIENAVRRRRDREGRQRDEALV